MLAAAIPNALERLKLSGKLLNKIKKTKEKFNPNAIKFPLVFDSPNNAELDDQNIARIFKYILKCYIWKIITYMSTYISYTYSCI